MKARNTLFRIAVPIALLALVAAACGSDDDDTQVLPAGPTVAEDPGTASVRVAHFSPDAPNVDVYVDDQVVLEDVPFPAVSDYLNLAAGEHTFAVRAAGAEATSDPVFEASATLDADEAYTVAAVGTLDSIGPAVFADDLSDPAAGSAHVRAIHAIPDVGPVDVAPEGGDPVIAGLASGEASSYIPVPAGDYTFEVRAAGTTDVLLTISATLADGTITSVAAVGEAGEGTARLEAYQDK